jgi:hypothetical protein
MEKKPSSTQIQHLRMKIARKARTPEEEWAMLEMLGLL